MFNSSDNPVALKVLAGATTNHRMQNPAPIADVLGIRVHTVTMEQVLKILTEMVFDSHPHHIMTVNPEFVMIAQRNKEFRDVLAGTSLNLPDGIGIVLAARILGFPMLE